MTCTPGSVHLCAWGGFFLITKVDLTAQLRLMKEQLGIVPCTPMAPERKNGSEERWEAPQSTSFRLHVWDLPYKTAAASKISCKLLVWLLFLASLHCLIFKWTSSKSVCLCLSQCECVPRGCMFMTVEVALDMHSALDNFQVQSI